MSPRTATATKAPPTPKTARTRAPAPRTLMPPAVIVDRKLLLDALARVAIKRGAVDGVHIESAKGRLTVRATDLDLWLSTWIEAETSKSFEAIISPKTLVDLIRLAPGPVRIALNADDEIAVSFDKTEATLRTLPLGTWPSWRTVTGRTVSLSAPDVAVLRRVAAFASQDDARPILTAVLFAGNAVASTDSYRLAIGQVESELGDKTLFPASSVRLLPSRMLEGETVDITVGERGYAWEFDRVSVVTRRIDGEFPNYETLVPKATAATNRYTVNRKDLIMAVRRTEAVIPRDDRSKPVQFKAAAGELVVSTNVSDVGTVTERVDASVDGEHMSFAFNPRYFRECLGALTGESVEVQMADCLRPAMMVEHDLTMLLMPVRTS